MLPQYVPYTNKSLSDKAVQLYKTDKIYYRQSFRYYKALRCYAILALIVQEIIASLNYQVVNRPLFGKRIKISDHQISALRDDYTASINKIIYNYREKMPR